MSYTRPGGSPSPSLPWFVAASSASAYRSLVLALVVSPVSSTVSPLARPAVSLVSLLLWIVMPLLGAAWRVWEPIVHAQTTER
mgnify:CR=1 FL=1